MEKKTESTKDAKAKKIGKTTKKELNTKERKKVAGGRRSTEPAQQTIAK